MRSLRFQCVGVTFLLLLLAVLAQAQETTPLPDPRNHGVNRLTSPRTLPAGGAQTQNAESGDTSSGYSVLYSFCAVGGEDCTDGSYPQAALIQDAEGNLYSTTSSGGLYQGGTVFKLNPATKVETVLYRFGSDAGDGAVPFAGLIRDTAGNLYGTTTGAGAHDEGTVFKLDSKNDETVLYNFCSTLVSDVCTDGQLTDVGLIQDAAGESVRHHLQRRRSQLRHGIQSGPCDEGRDGALQLLLGWWNPMHRRSVPLCQFDPGYCGQSIWHHEQRRHEKRGHGV